MVLTCFFKLFITVFSAVSFFSQNSIQLEAVQAKPPKEKVIYLDLTYIDGGDFIRGIAFNEEQLTQKILSYPNLVELKLTGQSLSPHLMSIINRNLPKLNKLTITGSIRFFNGDGLWYSSEYINEQIVSEEMLQALFCCQTWTSWIFGFYDPPIEILDLSLSTIDDKGLELISQRAYNLREIYLKGANHITDTGIISLVDKLPNLKLIDLGSYILRKPCGDRETIAPQVSEELIKTLLDRGITVI